MNSAPARRPIDVGAWNSVVDLWQASWSSFADPARQVVAAATALAPGTSVLDLGCGSGEFLAMAAGRGADVAGLDDADAMIDAARRRVPDADLRVGSIEDLPWPDDVFDVVTAFNAVQFAGDRRAALAEARRVARNGALVAVSAWGAARDCEVEAVALALAAARGPTGGRARAAPRRARDHGRARRGRRTVPARRPGRARAVRGRGRGRAAAGVPPGRDPVRRARPGGRAGRPRPVADAAAPYRRPDGSYRFENVFRVVVARAWRGSYRLR